MVRRDDPGLDGHVVSAHQRAIVRAERPHQAARPLPGCQDGKADQGGRQDIAQTQRIQLAPFRRQVRQLQLPRGLQQPVTMTDPQRLRAPRWGSRPVGQRGYRTQRRLAVEQLGSRFVAGRRIAPPSRNNSVRTAPMAEGSWSKAPARAMHRNRTTKTNSGQKARPNASRFSRRRVAATFVLIVFSPSFSANPAPVPVAASPQDPVCGGQCRTCRH